MAKSMSNELRKAIKSSGQSANQIAKATGVPQATISRFLLGADMRLSTAEKLAPHFGLGLQLTNKKRRK